MDSGSHYAGSCGKPIGHTEAFCLLRKVELSEDEGGIRLTGGLTVGARIVTAGIHSLKQGQQVRIEQDATP